MCEEGNWPEQEEEGRLTEVGDKETPSRWLRFLVVCLSKFFFVFFFPFILQMFMFSAAVCWGSDAGGVWEICASAPSGYQEIASCCAAKTLALGQRLFFLHPLGGSFFVRCQGLTRSYFKKKWVWRDSTAPSESQPSGDRDWISWWLEVPSKLMRQSEEAFRIRGETSPRLIEQFHPSFISNLLLLEPLPPVTGRR